MADVGGTFVFETPHLFLQAHTYTHNNDTPHRMTLVRIVLVVIERSCVPTTRISIAANMMPVVTFPSGWWWWWCSRYHQQNRVECLAYHAVVLLNDRLLTT